MARNNDDAQDATDAQVPSTPSRATPPTPAEQALLDAQAASEATRNERRARGLLPGSAVPSNAEQNSQQVSSAEPAVNHGSAVKSSGETLDATVADDQPAPALESLEVRHYDPEQHQDATRAYIAYWLLILLTVLVIGSFVTLIVIKVQFADFKSILELILGPIVALVSAATGFYFGAQQSGKKP